MDTLIDICDKTQSKVGCTCMTSRSMSPCTYLSQWVNSGLPTFQFRYLFKVPFHTHTLLMVAGTDGLIVTPPASWDFRLIKFYSCQMTWDQCCSRQFTDRLSRQVLGWVPLVGPHIHKGWTVHRTNKCYFIPFWYQLLGYKVRTINFIPAQF